MPLNRHSRRSVDITLLSQCREHRDVPNLACGGRGGPRSAAACPGTTAGSTWNGFSSRAAARGRAGGRVPPLGARRCRREPPRGGRAPPDWPQRGDPGKEPRRREAAAARRMGGRAGFFEVGAGGIGGWTGPTRAGPRSILPPADGAARDPGGLLSLHPPSALKHRGAGAIRSRGCHGK